LQVAKHVATRSLTHVVVCTLGYLDVALLEFGMHRGCVEHGSEVIGGTAEPRPSSWWTGGWYKREMTWRRWEYHQLATSFGISSSLS
jgi:hypothetical protein